MGKSRPKKQHFAPRLHLQHFTGDKPPGMVWTYDLETGEMRPSIPKETGAETNFYSVERADGTYDDRVEEWLSAVETKAAEPYEKLLRGEIPQGQQRVDFSTYAASLYARSPTARRMAAEIIGAHYHAIMKVVTATPERFEEQIRAFEAERGPISANVRTRLYDYVRDVSRYTFEVHREATLKALLVSDELQELFFDMGWRVLGSDQQHIITCDSPVYREVYPREDRRLTGDGGFRSKNTAVTIPLSRSRVLLMRWNADSSNGIAAMNRKHARQVNALRAIAADRFLYASCNDRGISALGRKYHHRGNRLEFRGMFSTSELPEITVRRK